MMPQLLSKLRWKTNIQKEVDFWDHYFTTPLGKQFLSDYNKPHQLQPELECLLPKNKKYVNILDVGSGPICNVGVLHQTFNINLTATDSLAFEYEKILAKHSIQPFINVLRCDAEKLTEKLFTGSFD
jgi:hypothetical protein